MSVDIPEEMSEPNDSDENMQIIDRNTRSFEDDMPEPNDSDSNVQLVRDNVERRLRTFTVVNNCSKVVVGNWEIKQFRDSTPNIYINTLTMEQTHIKPIEILQLEAKPEAFVTEFYNKFNLIPLFDEMPYYVQSKLDYMQNFKRYNWNKIARNEYLNDKIISYLSNILKEKYPMVSGLFDAVELITKLFIGT